VQIIAVQQAPSPVVLGMPAYRSKLYAVDKGVDHPTPPAPDRGSKAKPKPAKTGKKK
jgi:hypothetical protein